MGAVKILLGIICITGADSSWDPNRNSLADDSRKNLVTIAQKEVGVQESSANSGPRVDQYNAYVGLKKVAWCASFVSWVFGQAGYSQPRTAWSPTLFPAERLTKDPLAGMVFGIYYKELKRIGHCGIVYHVRNDWIFSIEGNSNLNGGREGTGVYRRMRHIRSIHRFSNWLKK